MDVGLAGPRSSPAIAKPVDVPVETRDRARGIGRAERAQHGSMIARPTSPQIVTGAGGTDAPPCRHRHDRKRAVGASLVIAFGSVAHLNATFAADVDEAQVALPQPP